MEEKHPAFNFDLEYAGTTVDCKVVMEDHSYQVLFNGRLMATIAHTDDWNWIQESGVILPEEIVDEIGCRVESEYK